MDKHILIQLEESERRKEVAEGLHGILAILNSNQTLDAILDYITDCAKNLLDADAVAVYHLQPDNQTLTVKASNGLSSEYLHRASIPIGQAATGRSVLNNAPVTIENVFEAIKGTDSEINEGIKPLLTLLSKQFGAVLSVPLNVKHETAGALTLYYFNPRVFKQEDIHLAVSFCNQVALALENARLRDKIQEDAIAAERNRIARELHDSVTQNIFSANLIAEVLPTVWERDITEGRSALDELRLLTRNVLAEMRSLLLELRPAGLSESNLEDLIKQLTESVSGRMRTPIDLQVSGRAILPPNVKLTFYRIAQEALNNISKHSRATDISIQLISITPDPVASNGENSPFSQSVTLVIKDNGCGFDPQSVSSEHMGLGIMHERATNSHSDLKVLSKKGKGSEIILKWPR